MSRTTSFLKMILDLLSPTNILKCLCQYNQEVAQQACSQVRLIEF